MKNHFSVLICFSNFVIIAIILGGLVTTNLHIYKTSIVASFLVFIIINNLNQKNNLYNFIHNKTINI